MSGGSDQDRKLIANWLRRHKGARRFDSASKGEVRMAAHRRRRAAEACQLGGSWYIVKTAAKGEREARAGLQEGGFEAYLPEYKIEREHRRLRKKIVHDMILFPRYLFVRATLEQIKAVRDCEGVSDVLPGFPRPPEPIKADVVKKLRAAQAAKLLDDTDEGRKRRGETKQNALTTLRKRLLEEQVLVTDGPFKGFPGVVEAVHSLDRLRVLVSLFGRPTPVELERGQIEELAA